LFQAARSRARRAPAPPPEVLPPLDHPRDPRPLFPRRSHRHHYNPAELIPLTVNELRHLFNVLITEAGRRHNDALLWSIRRPRHQARALKSHYARQALIEL
jgi:hypothetical protein